MTTTDAELALRPPVWARAGIVAFMPVWAWIFVVTARPDGGYPVLALVIAPIAIGFIVRMLFLSVIGTADSRLTVRNHWSTRTFDRGEVTGVEIDRANGRFGQGWAVFLLLPDGARHRLDVTEAPSRTLFGRKLERDATAVDGWLEGRPQPFL
jgi:hypothetical protein